MTTRRGVSAKIIKEKKTQRNKLLLQIAAVILELIIRGMSEGEILMIQRRYKNIDLAQWNVYCRWYSQMRVAISAKLTWDRRGFWHAQVEVSRATCTLRLDVGGMMGAQHWLWDIIQLAQIQQQQLNPTEWAIQIIDKNLFIRHWHTFNRNDL